MSVNGLLTKGPRVNAGALRYIVKNVVAWRISASGEKPTEAAGQVPGAGQAAADDRNWVGSCRQFEKILASKREQTWEQTKNDEKEDSKDKGGEYPGDQSECPINFFPEEENASYEAD